MSLITNPLYIIHTSRIKFLRMDERGERIISFPPTVMSDDHVRLAAHTYPEMQYCYSPVYSNIPNTSRMDGSSSQITSSPRTTKRNYRQRTKPQPPYIPLVTAAKSPATTDSEDDDIEVNMSNSGKRIETGNSKEEQELTILETATSENTSIINRSLSFRPIASLQPSVDSAIDPSPRSSIDDHNIRIAQQQQQQQQQRTSSSLATTTVATSEAPTANMRITVGQQDAEAVTGEPAPLVYTKTIFKKPTTALSALSALIAEKATKAKNPFSEYSFVSGKGESKSIKLCVYLPHSKNPYQPVSLIVRPDAITDDVIGYILYDYIEEKRQPELKAEEYDLAEWCLLIAEDDGEIEDDLPAIDRTRNIGRVSFDQFALCRATLSQSKQNDVDRAKMGRPKVNLHEEAVEVVEMEEIVAPEEITAIENNNFSPNNNEDTLRDASNVAVPIPSTKATLTKATMPMTPLKYFTIKLMTNEEVSATTAIPVHADMFIGDVLELVSRKRKLDPNEYMLTIADVIVSNDTTVESMKGITDLTLVKRTTTLKVPATTTTHLWRSPIKRKKEEVPMYFTSTKSGTSNDALISQYKKYIVSRKMPMFVSKRLYIMAIDGDYIHLMPPEHKGMFDSVKTTSFHAGAIRSCKQSKKVPTNFKIIILKERDFKTYDLEAENPKEASEICSRLRFLMQVTKGGT